MKKQKTTALHILKMIHVGEPRPSPVGGILLNLERNFTTS